MRPLDMGEAARRGSQLQLEPRAKPVQLEPFVHQVGGHSSMLRYDDTTVCKQLISREHHFYQSLPPAMGQFIPEYRGIIEVSFQEDPDGYITLEGHPTELPTKRFENGGCSPGSSGEGEAQSDSDGDSPARRTRSRARVRRSGSIEVEVRDRDIANGGHNPWSLQCHKEQLAKMRKANLGSDRHKFILLENVVSSFTFPCILDLKMGTRQHGDDASEEKRQSQIRKCESTTSSTLGVRICGMQVYQSKSDTYLCRNKYHGRKLTVDGFRDALHQFLNNNGYFLSELIDPIIEKLQKLHDVLKEQNTFRFYSSSLLIIYDAKDVLRSFSRLDITEKSAKTRKKSVTPSGSEESVTDVLPSNQRKSDQSDQGSPERSRVRDTSRKSKRARSPEKIKTKPRVDVRMIDFAHTTHQGFRDKKLHNGPDLGYIFGLQNLIQMLTDIRDINCSQEI